MSPNAAFPIFFAVWGVLAVSSWIFYWKGSLEAKRRWHPRIAIGAGVVFLGFVGTTMPFALVFAAPAVVVITLMNLKMTKFCSSCGATLFQNPPWSPPRFCSKCGANLQQ